MDAIQQEKEVDKSEKSERNLALEKQKKIKYSVYFTEEVEKAFVEIYIGRLRKDPRADKSQIVCDAILNLFEKECSLEQ